MSTTASPRMSITRSATAAVLAVAVAVAITILTWPSSAVANATANESPCRVGLLLPAVGLQPGESVRVSVVDTGEFGDGSVWGVRLRSADGTIVAEKLMQTKTGGSASLHHVIPPMPATQGDQRRAFTDLSSEIVLLQGDTKTCSTPLASVQGFDVQGRSTFLIAEWPPYPWRHAVPPTDSPYHWPPQPWHEKP